MTNEEFIILKRQSKFDIIWSSLIKKLPKSSQPSLEKNGCAFNSKFFNHKEHYIICRRTEKERGSTIYLNKCDVESVFVDYEGCVRDLREYQIGARERLYNGLEVFQSDINKL